MARTKEQIRKQFGIPDWRDAAAYPKTISNDGWRWEFLRRRADYRKDWAASPHTGIEVGSFAKYGLQIPIDPALSHIHGFCPGTFVSTFERGTMEPGALHGRTIPALKWTIPEHCCAIAFNYRLPLKPQLEHAENSLLLLQKHLQIRNTSRKRQDKYADYLRALDAEAAGATYQDIANVLLPSKKGAALRARGEEIVKAAHHAQDLLT